MLCVSEEPACEDIEMPLTSDVLEQGVWVIVQYPYENQRGYRRYIGQILDISMEDGYLLDYVRPKNTKNENGYIYTFPNIRDNENWCQRTQIIKKIEPPILWQRSLKFCVHCDKL